MNLNRRALLKTSLSSVALYGAGVGVSSAWAAAPEGYPADYAAIIEASKSESGVLMYHSLANEHLVGFVELMKQKYPWIKVDILDTGSEAFGRYLAESSSGTRTADMIVVAAANGWIDMIERDAILPYDSPEGTAYPEWSIPHPGLYSATVDPSILLYNKMLLPEDLRPRSFADIVDLVQERPDVFANRMTSYSPTATAYGYSLNYHVAKYHGETMWEWWKILKPATRYERSVGVMTEKVTSGEYVLAYLSGSSVTRDIMTDPARADLLGWGYFEDGTPMILRGAAIPRDAANPNSAKLALDVLLSREGQLSLGVNFRTPARKDISSADIGGGLTYTSIVESVGEDNLILIDYDKDLVTKYDEFVRRFETI